jgi:acyl carrier protein
VSASVAAQVRALIDAALPVEPEDVTDDAALGEDGLGLDSVGVVDLLFACEERFGIELPAEVVLDGDGSALTVGALVAHVAARLS